MKRLLMVLFLAGCAELPLPTASDPVDAIFGEVVNAARAPAGEQKAALSRAHQAFSKDSSSVNRFRLGLLLAMLPAPLRDDARALELLEPLSDAGSPGVGRFAAVLTPLVAERQRVTRDFTNLSRERERTERERIASDRERDKREEALKQQLEALRSIERGILEREDRLRKGARK